MHRNRSGAAHRRPLLVRVSSLVLGAGLAAGCASAPTATQPAGPSVPPTIAATGAATPASVATPSPKPTTPTIGLGDQALSAGTYRVDLAAAPTVLDSDYPTLQATVPEAWNSVGGWLFNHLRAAGLSVAVQFWKVDQVYGHPCQWSGTLFQPGPTVDDLAKALGDRPVRKATAPIDVTVDGYAGKYLEWSVPADAEFSKCDTDAGTHYFESWIGPGDGDRYQQGPGQLDRLWILDVDGSRLVIDGFSMVNSTPEDIEQLMSVIKSIKFER